MRVVSVRVGEQGWSGVRVKNTRTNGWPKLKIQIKEVSCQLFAWREFYQFQRGF